jgi:hypothetical protein
MNLTLIILLNFSIIILYYYFLKNTVFGVSPNTGNYLGFFIFYGLIVYIVPSTILLNLYPIENFWVAFQVKQKSVFWISILIILSISFFYISLKILSKVNKKYLYLYKYNKENINLAKNVKFFTKTTIIFCLLLIATAWIFYGVGHSFTLSILNDISISILRADIKSHTSMKGLKHLFILITPFLTAIIASNIYNNNKKERFFLFLAILFIASWAGSKGPLLKIFLVYLVSYATFNHIIFNLKSFFKILIFITLMLVIVYQVVLLQYAHMTSLSLFFDYFTQRVFVAQMIGTYEEFNLWIHDISYIWHGVPFASSFIEFPVFHKDLMMISENRIDPSSIGIKNTFFIAEAYGMGGWTLLVLSPFWIALTYSITYIWIVFIFNKIVFNNLEYTKRIVAISLFSYITVMGGFSDLMLFKITIMVTILLFPFLSLIYLQKILVKSKNYRGRTL